MRTALVTGSTRGFGLEVAAKLLTEGYRVVVTGREASAVARAVASLPADAPVLGEVLDVTRESSVRACASRLALAGIDIDVLVNHAQLVPLTSLLGTDSETLRATFETNFWGAVWTARAWAEAMAKRDYGRIVNVSSGAGALADGLDGPGVFALSKAALNALTVRLASELPRTVLVNAVCPGGRLPAADEVATSADGRRSVDTVVWLATLPDGGPTGGFFHARARIPW